MERYFSHYSDSHRAVGEGSVSYLYLPGVIERINRLNPTARFIVLIRNPLSMLPSYHLRMRFLLQEDEADFSRAWKLEGSRKRGENIPENCLDSRLLQYSDAAKFGVQVKRLFETVGRDRAHVIVFDDFKSDPLKTYRRTLEFLEVDYDGQNKFERRHGSQMYRYRWLQKIFFVPAKSGGKILKTVQQRTRKYNEKGRKLPNLVKRIIGFNKIPMQPAPLSNETMTEIRETLREDIALLSNLLNRDLNYWLDES
ncbi:MAG: hypothetical protein NMNS01_14550 [Nitrosomonas sp.]|nr:MAG: hypothetical protein NMNS01_14550 [Nitrosomonas sp.]